MSIKIVRRLDESLSGVIYRFKRAVTKSRKLRILEEHSHYQKPSQLRRKAETRRKKNIQLLNGENH